MINIKILFFKMLVIIIIVCVLDELYVNVRGMYYVLD